MSQQVQQRLAAEMARHRARPQPSVPAAVPSVPAAVNPQVQPRAVVVVVDDDNDDNDADEPIFMRANAPGFHARQRRRRRQAAAAGAGAVPTAHAVAAPGRAQTVAVVVGGSPAAGGRDMPISLATSPSQSSPSSRGPYSLLLEE